MPRFLLIFLMSMFPIVSVAISPLEPQPYVVASEYGPFYITMFPEGRKNLSGIAYRLLDDGNSREMWRTKQFYAGVYLSSDGKFLIGMGYTGSEGKLSASNLAVAFLKRGKLQKQYLISDLIESPAKIRKIDGYYSWTSRDRSFPKLNYRDVFTLKTIEGIIYKFDVASGEIIERNKPIVETENK